MSQTINVDITPNNFQPTLNYSQGDVGRTFSIKIVSQYGDTLPSGATVKIQATKPSGFGFDVEADSVTDNVATFTTTAEMTDEWGRFPAQLDVTKDAVTIFSAKFLMVGAKNTHPEGTIDGSQGTIIPELTLLVDRVEAAASSVLDMEVEAQTLPAGSLATYSYDEALNKATFGIPQGEAGAGAAGVTASAYSASKTYAVGDYVIHNSNLYCCTTAITTAEEFTAAHWTQAVLGDDVTDLKSAASIVDESTEPITGYIIGAFHSEDFESGTLGWQSSSQKWAFWPYPKNIRTKENTEYKLKAGDVVRLKDYSNARFMAFCAKEDGTFWRSGWQSADYSVPYDGDYAFVLSNNPEVNVTNITALSNLLVIKSSYNTIAEIYETIGDVNQGLLGSVSETKDSASGNVYEYPITAGHTYMFSNLSASASMNCGTRAKGGTSNIETVASGLMAGHQAEFTATQNAWGIYVYGNSAHSFEMQDKASIGYISSANKGNIEKIDDQTIGFSPLTKVWENYTYSNGEFVWNSTRLCIRDYITVDTTVYLKAKANYNLYVVEYSDLGETWIQSIGWTNDYIRLSVGKYYIIAMRRSDNAVIKPTEAENIFIKEVSDDVTDCYQNTFNSSPQFDKEQDLDTPVKDFCALFNNTTGLVDSFLFFTDPHILGLNGADIDEARFMKYVATLQKAYNSAPLDYIVSGGDWLNSRDTQEQACYKLGYTDAVMNKMFKNFYPISGNHDTNYQGVVSSEDASSGTLSLEAQRNLWFRNTDTNKLYYSFKSRNSNHYVLNTGSDWSDSMDSYRWEQIAWLANQIKVDDAAHSSVLMHIIRNGGEEVTPMAQNVGALISAYNAHTTVMLNGITYNFATCTGHIDYVMGGHTHSDMNGTMGGVPYIITTTFDNVGAVSEATFDLCLADYGNNKLHLVRVGDGSNRTFDI